MSKPWDRIREKTLPPIGRGTFQLSVGPQVEVLGFAAYGCGAPKVDLRFGLNTSPVCFGVDGLRELAEFCTELAAQLESK